MVHKVSQLTNEEGENVLYILRYLLHNNILAESKLTTQI